MSSLKKRKSVDPDSVLDHVAAKKDRPWYHDELEKGKEKENPPREKRRRSFFGIGSLLTKMKSSSRLGTVSSSDLRLNPSGKDDESFSTASVNSSVDSIPIWKKNADLRKAFDSNNDEQAKKDDSNSNLTADSDSLSGDSIGSAASLCTPRRGLDRLSELRGSSRSMPGGPVSDRGDLSSVRRAHSTASSSPFSPGHWLRGKSVRMRKDMCDLQEEEETGEAVRNQPVNLCASSVTPTQTASFSRMDRSRSAVSSIIRGKHSSFLFAKKHDSSSHGDIPSATEGVTPEGAPATGSGVLRRNITPSGTLSKFSSAIKRGFSSGSRSLAGAGPSAVSTTPLGPPSSSSVVRRTTMDKSKKRDMYSKRRCSDITSYKDISFMKDTPSRGGLDETRRHMDPEACNRFTSIVSVIPPRQVPATDSVVVEVKANGEPNCEWAEQKMHELDALTGVHEAALAQLSARAGVVKPDEESDKFVVWVPLRGDDSCRALRSGVDAAVELCCQHAHINTMLLPHVFRSGDEPSTTADALVRTLFKTLNRHDNHTKLTSVLIMGMDEEDTQCLQKTMDRVIDEKMGKTLL